MAVSAVTQAFSSYAQQVTGTTSASPKESAAAAAQQEASETASTTKAEAAHGDRQAKAKLAKIQQKQELTSAAPASEPGKGTTIDRKS